MMKNHLLRLPLFLVTYILVSLLLDRYAFHKDHSLMQVVITALFSYCFFVILVSLFSKRLSGRED